MVSDSVSISNAHTSTTRTSQPSANRLVVLLLGRRARSRLSPSSCPIPCDPYQNLSVYRLHNPNPPSSPYFVVTLTNPPLLPLPPSTRVLAGPAMSMNRSFESRRTPSIRFFSLSKSLREFRTQESAASSSSQLILPDGGGEKGLEASSSSSDRWADLLPELLGDIFGRVEVDGGDTWPNRRSIVAFGCVCRRWRQVTREIVESPRSNGRITFPSCLKQPGPRDSPLQCLIKRDRRSSTFYLYLSVSPSSFTEQGKFLLAARRYKHGPHNEYIIALDANDMSQGSRAYMGKLSSDFIGTNFTIYDSEPPHDGAKPSRSKSTRRFASKQISPQVSAGNFEVGKVSYKFNLLKSRGPRRIICSIKRPPMTQGAKSLTPSTLAENVRSLSLKKPGSSSLSSAGGLTVLRNKAPRWHENLQCWCLNFHGRVTVASVKNFQLTTMVEKDCDEAVVLQFGKVGDDTFTMDFQQPLSAFQAFAICLTSFGTKLACE